MHLRSLAFVLLAMAAGPCAFAQIVVELPFDAGTPAREMRSREQAGADLRGARPLPLPTPSSRYVSPGFAQPIESVLRPLATSATLAAGSTDRIASTSPPPPPPPPESIVLTTFDGTAGSGSIRSGTTWVGNVSQGAGYITIGGTARDDNGFGATGLSLNATAMNTLTITAQRNAGHAAGSLFLQLEDRTLGTRLFAFDATLFAVGTPTQVQIVIGVWSADFDFTQISGWNIGGGGVGTLDFRMSLHQVEFSATAIPEPSTVAALMGFAVLGAAFWQRRRRRHPATLV